MNTINKIKLLLLLSISVLLMQSCSKSPNPCGEGAGNILDEALCVGRTADTLAGADEDYFSDMDNGISQRPAELLPRIAPFVPVASLFAAY